MKKIFLTMALALVLMITEVLSATDFSDTDQIYGWDGSAQFWQTWAAHKTQLQGLFYTESEVDILLGDKLDAGDVTTVSTDVETFLGSANQAAMITNLGLPTSNFETTGTIQGKMLFNSYTSAQTLTAADHNASIAQMTTADEVTMWDCEAANVGDFVLLWAKEAEKIEVVPASGDHFNLFNGTALAADNELDMAATAGTKVTLICTADDTWSVYSETAACTDGGTAD